MEGGTAASVLNELLTNPHRKNEHSYSKPLTRTDTLERPMDWIEMAQEKDRWWALVNAVMNLRVPQNVGNFLTS
jgi:hypothetical protein